MKGTVKTHYFITDFTLEADYRVIEYSYNGIHAHFTTNSGMFSPKRIDYASQLLVSNLPVLKGRVLDLGCGYGYIGIMLKLLNQEIELVLSDINERALDCAKINCETNGISSEIILSDGFTLLLGDFDYIINNPPIHAGKEVVFRLFNESYHHLKKGGCLFIVIQKKHGANSSYKRLIELFGNCTTTYKHKGYYIYCCTRLE